MAALAGAMASQIIQDYSRGQDVHRRQPSLDRHNFASHQGGDNHENNRDPESLTGGDRAVGEEELQKDLGMRDLTQYLQDYKRQYGDSEEAAIDWARISNVGLIGGLLGATFSTLIYNKNERSKSYFFWGLMLGGLAASFLMYVVLLVKQLRAEADTGYEKEMAEKKAALRRKEQEVFERHDEFVYYDAAKQHSCLFKFLYCPHYGKITSERIIYSEQTLFPTFESSSCLSCLPSFGFLKAACAWPWAKKVQSMDIDTVLDAGVEQSCIGYVNNSGTVVISVNARADASAVASQRDLLRRALQQKSLPLLHAAIDGCGVGMPELKQELAQAKTLADELAQEAGEEGAGWAATPTGNSLTRLNVLSVTNPYAVLDDLSYKITKNKGQLRAGSVFF